MDNFRFHRRYHGTLQAVILDWAGTTVDYGCCAPAVVFCDVFKDQGVAISIEEAREPMGMEKKAHIRAIANMPAVANRWRENHGRVATEDDVERMYREFIPRQLDCLADYADLVPGTLEAADLFRRRGMKIGSTTGYSGDMMAVVVDEAKQRGFETDSNVSASDVPVGRPAPWMCFLNLQRLGVYPLEACVKIGDTPPDIAEGLNAGMWTIGVAKAGNEVGLTEAEIAQLSADELDRRLRKAYARLNQSGAHYVIDSIADVQWCLDDIERRLANGERP
jgi:phosphonoacetaldehyde hydrolase